MTRLSIELADDVKEKLEAQAARWGHVSVEEYVQAVLSAEAEELQEDYNAPSRVTYSNSDELEAVLAARMKNPAPGIEATPDYWANLKKSVAERYGKGA